MHDVAHYLPLSPRMFHVLLALAEGPRNGYQVSLIVEEKSQGRVRLSPATQYENINRLSKLRFIHEVVDDPECRADGRGQRYWRLTERGKQVLKAEVERLSADLSLALATPLLRD